MADSDKAVIAGRNSHFQGRIKHFMEKAAIAVMAEAIATPGHTERLAYAATVLDGTAQVIEYTVAVLTNSTVLAAVGTDGDTASVTDADLEFTVNSMFSAFAGFATGT